MIGDRRSGRRTGLCRKASARPGREYHRDHNLWLGRAGIKAAATLQGSSFHTVSRVRSSSDESDNAAHPPHLEIQMQAAAPTLGVEAATPSRCAARPSSHQRSLPRMMRERPDALLVTAIISTAPSSAGSSTLATDEPAAGDVPVSSERCSSAAA